MVWKQTIPLILIAVAAAFVSGCGGGSHAVPSTGTVLVDGKPVAGLVVMFVPKDTKLGKMASGRTDESGAFTLTTNRTNDGAMTGEYKVLVKEISDNSNYVAANAVVPKPNDKGYKDLQRSFQGANRTAAQTVRIALEFGDPEKTTLKATVKPSANDNKFKFEVSARPGA
jgi:hypothetical protein